MKLIETRDLTLQFGNKTIIENINLTINSGEFLSIIGPNGGGKTMLIKAICGIYNPSYGKIIRSDNLRVGYMPQVFMVEKSIPLMVKHFLQINIGEFCPEEKQSLLKKTGIEHLMNSFMQNLSGGQMQRVMLCRAILQKPNLLILDEPAQNLDIKGQKDIYKIISSIHEEHNIAVLMISHDIHIVLKNTQKIIFILKNILAEGNVKDVANNPKFKEIFGKNNIEHLCNFI